MSLRSFAFRSVWESKSERERKAISARTGYVRCLSTTSPTATTAASESSSNVWQETKNRQGRVYYVNSLTGAKQWDHPGQSATVLKIPRLKRPEFKNMSERIMHTLTNSTTAYYGLFALFCAGLTYRIMYPPKPTAPTIGVAPEVK